MVFSSSSFFFRRARFDGGLFGPDLFSELFNSLAFLRLDLLLFDVLDQQVLQSVSQLDRERKQATHGYENHDRP